MNLQDISPIKITANSNAPHGTQVFVTLINLLGIYGGALALSYFVGVGLRWGLGL